MSVHLVILSFMPTVRILLQVNLRWAIVTLIKNALMALMHKFAGRMLKTHLV